jgi:hypothetical protein
MAALITVEEFKALPLPIKSSMYDKLTDEVLLETIERASENVEDYLDRRLASAYYTQRIPGNGRSKLLLDEYPVTQLVSLTNTAYNGATTAYDISDIIIDSAAGILYWVNSYRWAFWQNTWWNVHYRAGYTTIPGPVKHAVGLQTVNMLQPLFRGGTNMEQVDLIVDQNEMIVDLLEKYKRKRIG